MHNDDTLYEGHSVTCPSCGSDNIEFKAYVRFNSTTERIELKGDIVEGSGNCLDCHTIKFNIFDD